MIELRVLELLCARFCHEMVSPVGAVSNGVELLDEDDPDFVREAMGLIGQSPNARLVLMPMEVGGLVGTIAGIAELAKGGLGPPR